MPTEPGQGLLAQIPELIGEAILVVAGPDEKQASPTIVYVNGILARLLGRPSEELIGQSVHVLAARTTDPLEFARLVDALERQRPVDLTVQIATAQGRDLWVEIEGRPLGGEAPCYLLHLRDVTAQRAATAAAQRLERRFGALAELTSDGVYYLRVEPDCRLALDWTAGAFERLTRYSVAEIAALGGWTALVDPADLRTVQRWAQRLLGGERASAEYRIRTRTGERRWLHHAGQPQWDDARELVIGILCVAQDITERRRLEEQILAQERDRKALITLTESCVCEVGADGRLREITGDVRGELGNRLRLGVGRALEELLGLDLAEQWRREIERIVPGWPPVTFEFGYPASAGEERYQVRMTAAAGGGALALIRFRPMALVRSEAVASAAELRALLNLHRSPAVLLSRNLEVLDLNDAAEQMTGWRREDARGRRFVELMALAAEQPSVIEDLERALSGSKVAGSEAWLRLPDGQEGRIVWTYTPLRGAGGEVLGLLAEGDALAPLDEPAPVALDEQRLKAIMDNVADGIVTLDRHGAIVSFSRSAETVFGYRSEELIGRSVELLIVPEPRGNGNALERIMATAKLPGGSREMMVRRKSGEVIPIELAVSEVGFNGDVLYILTVRDITVRKLTEETIRNLAYHDPLTGLPNRLLFNDRLTQAIERARRNQQLVAVMILDLDRFKLINDSLGLASGDQVLRAVGERLAGTVRRSDTVARLGGDDFLLMLPGVEGAESAAKVAQKILDTFTPPLRIDDHELHLGASLGITLYPHDGDDAETLIRNADTALYRAKENSRGSYQFYTTDMNATAFERLVLETQLRKALERGELIVYYQPQVRLDDGAVVAVEALVRWFHSELGLISPAEFIPLAEETGLIVELGSWVLNTACSQVRRWQEQGFEHLRLAVNLSSRQFEQEDLVPGIARLIEQTGFDPADLELELTESSIMRNPEQAMAKLQALDRLGIRLSIDDFGTGYSSLGHLKRFPIRTLKIDQSFIQDITTDPNDAAIAQAIIALAESLQLKVIAEGVETKDQLNLLRRYHCDEMQGYLFARPMPADELWDLLRRRSRLIH